AGVGGDREVGALGEPGERADQGVGQLAVLVGVEQHLVDVPGGVVVGEDRLADVLVAAGGPQVAGGGADRVDRVVGVAAAVVVGVHPVGGPGRGDELHPALGAGGGDVQVGAEGGLDLVDRGEHLPGDAVLGAAGLVDRQEEGRDLKGVDDEVGDADRGGAELGDGEPRVLVGGRAVGVAQGGLGDLAALGLGYILGALPLLRLLAEQAGGLGGGLLVSLAAAGGGSTRAASAARCRGGAAAGGGRAGARAAGGGRGVGLRAGEL